jgi:hypothetical protein
MGVSFTYNHDAGNIIVSPIAIPPVFSLPNKNEVDLEVLELMEKDAFNYSIIFPEDNARTGSVRQSMLHRILENFIGNVEKESGPISSTSPAFIPMDNVSVHYDAKIFDELFAKHQDNLTFWYSNPNTTHWSAPCDS